MAENKKNLFVFVPNNAVSDFKNAHLASNVTNSDDYWSKVSFLGGTGEIATHGQTFGMSTEFAQRIGLTEDITTSNTLMSYISGLNDSLTTLNGGTNVEGSVDKKINDAMQSLVSGAPTAYDTITEIAAWIQDVQGQQGTAAAVASTLAKVGPLEQKLGSYTVADNQYTYTGVYLFAHNAAAEEAAAVKTSLNNSDSAVAGQYVSSVSLNNGTWTITRANLPVLSVNSNSSNYASVNDHEISILTSTISSTTGFVFNETPESGHSRYELGDTETIGTGLVTASAVYSRLRADETFIADALSSLDSRITTVVSGATGDLDASIRISDSNSYVTAYIIEEDGKLKASGSYMTFDVAKIYDQLDSTLTINATENSVSYGSATIAIADGKLTETGSSLTINKTNILAKTEATVSSPTTGTGSNEYVVVNITTENHDVTEVTVEFDPWEEYVAS